LAKSAQQIATENNLPQSATCKKIRKLCNMNLLCVDRIQLRGSSKSLLLQEQSAVLPLPPPAGKAGAAIRKEPRSMRDRRHKDQQVMLLFFIPENSDRV
jgi:hypothetical protein